MCELAERLPTEAVACGECTPLSGLGVVTAASEGIPVLGGKEKEEVLKGCCDPEPVILRKGQGQ